jgi:hypothetical protein
MTLFACCGFPGSRSGVKETQSASEISESFVTSVEIPDEGADTLGTSGEFHNESVAGMRGSFRESGESVASMQGSRFVRAGSIGRNSYRSTGSSVHTVEDLTYFRDKEAMVDEIIRLRRALAVTSRELTRTAHELETVLNSCTQDRTTGTRRRSGSCPDVLAINNSQPVSFSKIKSLISHSL